MNLNKIQDELREIIILSRNPECKDIEEALEKELGFGCVIQYPENKATCTLGNTYGFDKVKDSVTYDVYGVVRTYDEILKEFKILGLPIRLNDVLRALGKDYACGLGGIVRFYDGYDSDSIDIELYEILYDWNLDKTLFEQEEEVQRNIWKIFNNK